MKKGMISFMAFVAMVFVTVCLISCSSEMGRKARSVSAKGHVPVICQEKGKFSYYTPFQNYVKVYPIGLLDSVRAVPRTPEVKVNFRIISKDSFMVSVFAPVECPLKNMDKLKFVYPPKTKFSVRKDIVWNQHQIIALAPKFWLVGEKKGITSVYTPEGEMLPSTEADEVLRTAVDQPELDEIEFDVVTDSVP